MVLNRTVIPKSADLITDIIFEVLRHFWTLMRFVISVLNIEKIYSKHLQYCQMPYITCS